MSLLYSPIQEVFDLIAQPLQSVKASLGAITPPNSAQLADAVSSSLNSGGKYLRPALTLLVGKASASNGFPVDQSALVEAAAVTEMIHVATLLHDDVLDASDLRRGKETARAVWGDKIAILGGDYLLAQASVKLSALGNTRLVSIFAWVLSYLCDGEVEQMQSSFSAREDGDSAKVWAEKQWKSYFHKTFCKTGSLFAAACEAAGVINQLSEPKIEALRDFGRHLGIAFQIMDDLLDYTATEEQLGKPVMGDLRNGLINAPILLALESDALNDAQQYQLRQAIDQMFTAPTNGCIEEIQALLQDCNALEKSKSLARHHLTMGLKGIDFIGDSPARRALDTVAEYVIGRNS